MTPQSGVATISDTKCDVAFEFVIFYLFVSYDAAYSKHIMVNKHDKLILNFTKRMECASPGEGIAKSSEFRA